MRLLSPDIRNEILHRRVFELLLDAVLVEDIEGKVILVNKSFIRLTGFSEKQIIDSGINVLIPEEFLEEFISRREQFKLNEHWDLETFLVKENGNHFFGAFKAIPLTDESENVIGRIISLNDITDTKQTLNTLRQSDDRLRFLMEVSTEGIMIHEKGFITDVNEAAIKMLGYAYEELVGKSVFSFYPESEHARIAEAMKKDSSKPIEKEILNKNKEVITVEITARTLIYEGREIRVINLRDVTELKKKRVEEERLVSIFDRSPLFIGMMDEAGLRYVNPAGRKMIGVKLDEQIGHFTINDLMTEESAKMIRRVAIPASIRTGSWKGQTYFKTRDGGTVPASQIILAHRNKKGEVDFLSSIAENITERLKTEQILVESEERLRYFMEESLEAILIQEDGTVIDFNTAASKMFGYNNDEICGIKILSLYDISFHKEIKEKIKSKNILIEEWVGVKKDGTRFDIEVYSRPHQYKGKDVRVVSILDITLRKKTERALRSSELLLNTAVDGTNIGIWEWNLVTNQVSFNHVKKKICGYTDKDSPQFFDQWAATIHADDREGLMERLKGHMYENRAVFHAVYRVKHANGKWIVLESKGKIVRDENGLPLKFVGTSIDITERQQMEDELRQSKAQLTAMIENRVEAIWSIDTNLNLVSFNKPFIQGFKRLYNQDLLKGTLVTSGLNEKSAAEWTGRYEECLEGKSLRFVEKYDLDGNLVFVEYTGNPVRLSDDTIVGVSVMGRDITQQIHFEESLKNAKEQAEEANRTKSQFLANISHEIRTPMNGIMGFTDLLLISKLNAKQREYIEMVRYSADALLTLINDLLDISKIESGMILLMHRKFEIRKLLRDIIATFEPKAELQKLKINSTVDKWIPKILIGDELRLRQIFVNLLSNAVKFSSKGKVNVRVKLRKVVDKKAYIFVEIEDKGIGIPKDKLESIFVAFNQIGDPYTSKYGGTGLGLSIAKRLVNLMKGEIGVESEPKKGSKFFFTVCLQLPE